MTPAELRSALREHEAELERRRNDEGSLSIILFCFLAAAMFGLLALL